MVLSNQRQAELAVIRQLYLERYKANNAIILERKIRDYARRLAVEASLAVSTSDFSTVSKTAFAAMLREFRAVESETKAEMRVVLFEMLRKVLVTELEAYGEEEPAEDEVSLVLTKVIGSYLGGSESTVGDALNKVLTAISSDVAKTLTTAYVQQIPISELNALLLALPDKASRWAIPVFNSATQQGSQVVSDRFYSSPKYVWVSVLDSRTTDICRGRHGMVFVRGKGPLPPAHLNCRSTTSPYVEGQGDIEEANLNLWVKRFPPKVRADLLSNEPLTAEEYIQRIRKYGFEEEN